VAPSGWPAVSPGLIERPDRHHLRLRHRPGSVLIRRRVRGSHLAVDADLGATQLRESARRTLGPLGSRHGSRTGVVPAQLLFGRPNGPPRWRARLPSTPSPCLLGRREQSVATAILQPRWKPRIEAVPWCPHLGPLPGSRRRQSRVRRRLPPRSPWTPQRWPGLPGTQAPRHPPRLSPVHAWIASSRDGTQSSFRFTRDRRSDRPIRGGAAFALPLSVMVRGSAAKASNCPHTTLKRHAR
jgi:hypothetical protein